MNRFQYAAVDQSGPSKWAPMAAVAVAVSLGVVVGLVLSTPSADATNLHAAVATTASTMRANTYASVPRQMSQYPRQAAVGASNVYDTEEVQYTAPAFVTEAQPAMSVAGWAGLMMVPVMALAGFMFGRRNTEFQVVDPVAEEQEFAMAATTGDKKQLYAVVAIGGHQYRVQPGEILPIEKIPLQKGDEFVFDKVLMVADGDSVELGQPYVAGQKVKAEVLRNSAGKKIRIFKYNAKKHTRLTQGHRQKYTDIHITEVNGHRVDSKVDWADSDSEAEPALA